MQRNGLHYFLYSVLYYFKLYQSPMLKNIKQMIKQLDFFEHPSLLRYQTEPGYRTLTGGIISIILIIIFFGLFTNLVLNTLTNSIVTGQINISYDKQPTLYDLKANAQSSRFMFALGITGMNLSSQRYFDIQLEDITVIKNTSGTFKTTKIVQLQQCSKSQWSGANEDITTSYDTLSFNQWLCPPTDFIFSLQGKFTSPTFKYSRILIQKCGTTSNSSTCLTDAQVASFISSNQGVTVSFYYINPVINAGDTDYLNYYLEDSNYFIFNTATGVNANLYFSEYHIETDHSIFPWKDTTDDQGALTTSSANIQTYSVTSNNQYAKLYLRKGSQKIDITRQFAKVDETLAFIGGLLGFLLLILTFVNVYNKFSYEIQFGDRIFKQNSNGTFGSQHFNFIVLLGYGLYNILTMFGVHLKWVTMRKYHECRIECLKQLDIHLLFKKIEFFEEVGNIVLEDHHLKGIFMLPKKKIKQVQESRRKFFLQALLYHQLDRKARQIIVQGSEYKKRHEQFFKQQQDPYESFPTKQDQQFENNELKRLKLQCSQSYKKLQDQSCEGQKYSQKIFNKIGAKQMLAAIFNPVGNQRIGQQIMIEPLPSIANLQIAQKQEDKYSQKS